MPGFTTYLANKILDHCLRGTTWSPPAKVYAQLHTGDPGPDGTANVAGTNTRKAITWSPASAGRVSMTAGLNWPSTAKETISHISIWDSPTAGNCLLTNNLDEAKNLFVGDTIELPTLTVKITAAA